MRSSSVLLLALVAAGCAEPNEGFIVRDLHGEIILPAAAVTRAFPDIAEPVVDARLIGPIYLGLYPSVRSGLFPYTHPEMGPLFQRDVPGDTYPYGGSSLGDIRFPCIEALKCKVVSGRYVDFDQMVTWFNETLQMPISDAHGDPVLSGDYVAQACYDQLRYVAEEEIRLTATHDRNDDGVLDEGDLDFVEQNDGTWRAEFTIWQQEYFENAETGTGFTLWGWMDAPSEVNNQFSTCDPNNGYQETEYNLEFFAGRPFRDLLNFPSNYIGGGDYVATEGFVYTSPDDVASITIDQLVAQ
jgi:hypothetical protein